MYDASTLIKIGRSIDIHDDPECNGLNENLNKIIFNGGKISYPWFYEQDSSDRFHLLDQDNILKLYFDNSNRDDFEDKIGSLVDYLGTFENQMKVMKDYIDYTNFKYKELERINDSHHSLENTNPLFLDNVLSSMLSEINETSKKYEVCWEAFIFSTAKFFLSDDTHDKYKAVFYGSSKKKIFRPAISKEAYDSINKELFRFFDEYGLDKQGYTSFFDFLENIIFAERDVENILCDSMSERFNVVFNEMYSDFFNNQKTMIAKYNSMVDLRSRIKYDIKNMSYILEKFVFLDSLSEIYDAVEMQKSNIDDIEFLESDISVISESVESARKSMTNFARKFGNLHNYEIEALCYLISNHDKIQSYDTLDTFKVHKDFRNGQSTENKIYYNAVEQLFRKISKNKKKKNDTKGPKIISDIQRLIESEPEYRVHKIQEELLLEKISTIKDEIAGMKRGIGSMNGSLKEAIDYMRKEEIDTAIFDPDKPDQKLNLSALVDLQEFLKAE